MLSAMKSLPLIFALILAAGCGGKDTASEPARPSGDGPAGLVAEPQMPEPLMRKSVPCCADLKLEKAVAAYTKFIASLAVSETSNELRDELAFAKFNESYASLEERYGRTKEASLLEKIKAIRLVYPQRISEAEPRDASQEYY